MRRGKNFINLTGRRFRRLVVIRLSDQRSGTRRKPMWECRCDCGQHVTVIGDNLRSGCSKSCGCLDRETVIARSTKHGAAARYTAEYRTWKAMKTRCLNPRFHKFPKYGGRGITICERWINDFSSFLADMGPRPPGHSIERLDNNGPYSPENCVWANAHQQARNKTTTRNISINGETRCLSDWAEMYGVSPDRVIMRLHLGWPIELALSEPLRPGVPLRHRYAPRYAQGD